MPELRLDPVTGSWVVVSTERAKRPVHFIEGTSKRSSCAFCYGHEDETPPETLAFRPGGGPPNSPGWLVRVVPNKYPVFVPNCDDSSERSGQGLRISAPSVGGHEVVIHSPDHIKSLPDLDVQQVSLVLKAYKERYLFYKNQPQVEYVEIIVNHGKDAGASLEHSHSQLFAMPLIPPAAKAQLTGTETYARETGRCVYCDTIAQERKLGERDISENGHFFCFAPYASRLPFESWIIPIAHSPFFEQISDEETLSLAEMLIGVLGRYNELFERPSYNLFLHTTPCKSSGEGFHWHIEIIPKLSTIAGFELGTSMMINVTTPEEAARSMRGDG